MTTTEEVLLIHGAGGGAWEWRDWEPVIQQNGLEPRAIDLMPAEAGLASTRFEDYQAQAELWFDEIQGDALRPPAVIGASLGGLLALKLAETRPVSALVLINPVPPSGVTGWAYRNREYPAVVSWADGLELADTRAAMPEADTYTIRWAHGKWRDESGLVMQAACDGVAVQAPGCPCLVQCGLEDSTVPLRVCTQTADLLGAQQRCYDRVSHAGALLGLYSTILAQEAAGWLAGILEHSGEP